MLLADNNQNVPKNKYIIKIARKLDLVKTYLALVLGSEQSYHCNPNPTFISTFFANFNSITCIHTNGIHFNYVQIRENTSSQPFYSGCSTNLTKLKNNE